ncbi:MAG: DUF4760 domain-containing protein [Oscillospiraceae bacterium]|nr:DUF4760 domain-containing protein [Oscillospiraceae bacterium]
MSVSEIFSIIANIAVILGIPVAVWTLKANHERQKKQSTVEFYQQISPIAVNLKRQISNIFDEDVINPTDEKYSKDDDLRKIVVDYLSLMERFSVGINVGIYDIDTFIRISGRATINWFYRLRQIIIYVRERDSQSNLYIEFEMMVKKMERKYNKKENNRGNIRFS